jgi:F-type H+-transporting ATPase subunit delta
MAKLISGRYADALFSIALESQKTDEFEKQAEFVLDTFNSDSDFAKVINHPQIGSDKKLEILENVFKDKVDNDMMGLFALVLRKNRETELKNILESFIGKVMEYKGIVKAYVCSAVPLSEIQLESIKKKLSENLNKQIDIYTEVDPSLIGGLKISVDGKLIDGTVKKRLDEIKKNLMNISAQ